MGNLNGEVGAMIESKILELKMELDKYQEMRKIYNTKAVRADKVETPAPTKSAKKRGSYNMTGKYSKLGKKSKRSAKISRKALKAAKKRTISPDWNIEIPRILQENGTALTTGQIVEKLRPGVHRATRKVLVARCSAILALKKKDGQMLSRKAAGLGTVYYLPA